MFRHVTTWTSAAAEAKRLIQPIQDALLELTGALVRTDSVNSPPRGNETAAQAVLSDFFAAHALTAELYGLEFLSQCGHPCARPDRRYTGRKNLGVRLSGSGRGRSLILNGHIDTVPPGHRAWTHQPWSAHRCDGRLYGLGSFDMKSGLAAQAAVVAVLQETGIRLGGDLLFQSVVDEEWGGGGGTLAALLRGDRADAAVISEGTQLEVLRATRGGFVVDLAVNAGNPAAYFSPEPVVSPAIHIGRLLEWVEQVAQQRSRVQASGAYAAVADPAPVQVLAVEANRLDRDVPLSVPLEATVRVYFQFLPEENVLDVLQEIRRSLDEFQRDDPFFRHHAIEWKPFYDPPLFGHELPEAHPWTECLSAAVTTVRGIPAHVSAAPYPCDAFLLQREFGIPTLLFGPAGGGAHNPDEYVEIDSLLTTAECLLAATLLWCNG